MTSMIKNALIKQLSKYLKNVSANQINISTFKGEGEMKNIELDENVLMELIGLPTWLKITNANCNRANVKVQWTKLKTQPIYIYLEKITLLMETTDELREFKMKDEKEIREAIGTYGFIDKCIDGMTISIDSISIILKSQTFNATLDLSNIYVYSVTPNWYTTQDIRLTRIKDLEKGEILMFKEISWETCRIEAYSLDPITNSTIGSPIKLIMNPSKAQITLKKKLADKSLVASTLRVLLNDIYWMASDTQLKAAIVAYNAIQKLITNAFKQKTKIATYKLKQEQEHANAASFNLSKAQQEANMRNAQQPNANNISKVFRQFDISETSLHMQAAALNVHLFFDENYSGNKILDGGTIQMLFKNLCLDHYPYHKVGASINNWNNFNHIFMQKQDFSKKLLQSFTQKLIDVLKMSSVDGANSNKISHINLIESCTVVTMKDFSIYAVTTNYTNRNRFKTSRIIPQETSNINDLQNSFFVQSKFNNDPFLTSNFSEFNLPPDTMIVNAFFSEYYFPEEFNYPVPSSHIYAQLSPFKINLDYLTLLWMNAFSLALSHEMMIDQGALNKFQLHCDVCLECILPKICVKAYAEQNNRDDQPDRPKGLNISCSRVLISNTHTQESSKDLQQLCNKLYKDTNLCMNPDKWPYEPTDLLAASSCYQDLVDNPNQIYVKTNDKTSSLADSQSTIVSSKNGLLISKLNKSALQKNAQKDTWCIELESAWLEFFEIACKQPSDDRTFLKPTSFKIWFVKPKSFYKSDFDEIQLQFKSAKKPLKNCIYSNEIAEQFSSNFDDLFGVNRFSVNRKINQTRKRRSKSAEPRSSIHRARARYDCINKYLLNSNANAVCHLKTVTVCLNHYEVLFLYRLLNEITIFLKQIDDDSIAIKKRISNENLLKTSMEAYNQNSKNATTKNVGDISITANLLIESIELSLTVYDKRRNDDVEGEDTLDLSSKTANSNNENSNRTKSFMSSTSKSSNKIADFTLSNDLTTAAIDDFVVISQSNSKNINYLIMQEHIQQIYGILDNSKYLSNKHSNDIASLNTTLSSSGCYTISFHNEQLSASSSSLLTTQSTTTTNSATFSAHHSLAKPALVSQILELNINSLFKSDKSLLRKQSSDIDALSIDTTFADDDDDIIAANVTLNEPQQPQVQQQPPQKHFTPTDNTDAISIAKESEPSSMLQTPDSEKSPIEKMRPKSLLNNVCVVKLILSNIQFSAQIFDENVSIMGMVEDIEFRDENSRKSKSSSSSSVESSKSSGLAIRLSRGVYAERKQSGAGESGFLEAKLFNKQIPISMSSLSGALELIEDESSDDKTIPIKILVNNSKFILLSDVASSNVGTSKIVIPMNVLIKQLLINRGANGEIILSGSEQLNHVLIPEEEEYLAEKQEYEKKQHELEQLVQKLKMENEMLIDKLLKSEDRVLILSNERNGLLQSIQKLDDQLTKNHSTTTTTINNNIKRN